MDGELSSQKRAREPERFMDAHSQLRQERLAVWEKTRLEPDLSVRFGEQIDRCYRHITARTGSRAPRLLVGSCQPCFAGALFLLRNSFTQDEAATPATTAAINQPAGPCRPAAPENKAGAQPVPENAASSPALAQKDEKRPGRLRLKGKIPPPRAASPRAGNRLHR